MINIHDYCSIPRDYSLVYENGIYSLLENDFRRGIDAFTEKLLYIQQKERYQSLPGDLIAAFPFVNFPPYKNEIFSRKQDLVLLESLLKGYMNKQKVVLEVSAWNGWLTKWLQSKEFDIISTDIFKDGQNGLGAKQFHPNHNWLSIQLDLTQPKVYTQKFDIIVFNHCLQFMPKPEELLMEYKKYLAKGGIMVLLGLDFFGRIQQQHERIRRFRQKYTETYNFGIHYYPCKGFLDRTDMKAFNKIGFNFLAYQLSFPGRINSVLRSVRSGIMYQINEV